jgi:hypothetical protein
MVVSGFSLFLFKQSFENDKVGQKRMNGLYLGCPKSIGFNHGCSFFLGM